MRFMRIVIGMRIVMPVIVPASGGLRTHSEFPLFKSVQARTQLIVLDFDVNDARRKIHFGFRTPVGNRFFRCRRC
jgi:hypothetical protein